MARGDARRTIYPPLRQIGLGVLNFEAAKKIMPNGGETTNLVGSPVTRPQLQRQLLQNDFLRRPRRHPRQQLAVPEGVPRRRVYLILPYMEKADTYLAMDPMQSYRSDKKLPGRTDRNPNLSLPERPVGDDE